MAALAKAVAAKPQTLLFFHPDLGIGGAERLIIDAAVGLQNRGHKVVIFTSHCDPKHCFDEARDGTLDVRVRGNYIPASILSRFSIICAILRQFHLILWTYFTSELSLLEPDAFVVDQLSAGLPWLRYLYPETRILFYCHFPDLLLAQGRSSWWKRAYRIPFDALEQWSMSFADSVVVNSGFTKSVVGRVWPDLVKTKDLQIVYPCVDVKEKTFEEKEASVAAFGDQGIILSINRFEKKKDIALAIEAYANLGYTNPEGAKKKKVRLVLAGGYDNRVQENVVCHKELVALAEDMGLKTATTKTIVTALNVPDDVDVLFLLSVPNTLKEMLLKSARLLVYTPSNEHFGIVPLEAMLAGVPVLACNTGGPLETVVDGKTGWLRAPGDVEGWTEVMNNVLYKMSDKERQKMGAAGKERVKNEFSDVKMAQRLDGIITAMASQERKSSQVISSFALTIGVVLFDAAFYFASQNQNLNRRFGKILLPPFTLSVMSLVSWITWFASAMFRQTPTATA
ncbi:glycosyltransferase family 4 protein [Halenospora varia]|nr:glycosyltransferase family 4 protein [Halenospora varia]